MTRYLPVEFGFYVTSTFAPRWGTFHWGNDYGRQGGSGGRPIYAAQGGTVTKAGPASGFGQWINIDHSAADGSGLTVYGHIIPEVRVGQRVEAGQRIGYINPDSTTNGGTREKPIAPHLHFEVHRAVWSNPGPDRLDPTPWLAGALWPGQPAPPPVPVPAVTDDDALWSEILTQLIGARR
ncbi:M23 family metallopeptidase [Rhodococcus sp. IEGM 1330]|uniref:M23 family metallopeptidase n=1 Tax=Rhodococcus sp. IEGM 1330 TaxID=3082225 RepID=UPI0029536F8C|nr:M23 family metallopeptidase [Rhodococcus sp. IEGM 1330]MDV8022255.1 M23 family metallopeptidase [Rhodococcus sp. IEGM 1330]